MTVMNQGMVMEAPPSPQSVGREFVRQYYTLLNQAPIHLHRFYNNQSSFVHGGLDPPNRETSPMIGQKQIHQKIQQLNFRDCHAKITQVDAQATLGNGVVVQVTGELSNAGEPMRRFTQTFVLAAQSPKKYYVHNDIFRYQDVIVSDDECEPECRSEAEDDLVQEHPVIEEISPPPINYFNPNSSPLQSTLSAVSHHHGQVPNAMPHVIPQPVATVNGTIHAEDTNSIAASQMNQLVAAVQGQNLGSSISNMQTGLTSPTAVKTADDIQLCDDQPPEDSLESNYSGQQDVIDNPHDLNQDTEFIEKNFSRIAVLSTEPKTYATLLKSGGNAGYSAVGPINVFSAPPKASSPPLVQTRYESRDASVVNQQSGNQSLGNLNQRMSGNRGPRNAQPRGPRQDSRNGLNGKNSFNEDGGNNYDDRRKSQSQGNGSFGDSYQLFLGNLPHTATEDELRDIFSAFGPIVDLRIHSKPGMKGNSGSRTPPNYGFITYENQQAVQNCLAAKPIHYPQNDKNGTVLNVEEKKTKDRLSYGGNRSGPDNGGGIRNRDNGNRRPGPARGGAGGGPVSGSGNRPNNFNRPPANRNTNNTTYNNRR